MDDELLRALGRTRRAELAAEPPEGAPVPATNQRLTTTERELVLDAVFARLDACESAVQPADESKPSHANVVAPSRWRALALVGTMLAAAAAVVLLLARPGAGNREAPTLPGYTITRAEGGRSDVRSDREAKRLHLRSPHDSIDVVVTPSSRVADEVDVAIVVSPERGPARLTTITDRVMVSPDGAVRIQGPLDRFVALEPGNWRFEVLVTPRGFGPTSLDALGDRPPGWRSDTFEATIDSG